MTNNSGLLLQQSPERLRAALESAAMGTWEWDVLPGDMRWDGRMHEHFGLAPGDFAGRYEDFLACIVPEERGLIEQEMRSAVERGGEYDGEFSTLSAPGASARFFRLRFTCPPSSTGSGGQPPAMVAGMCWEVTERRLSQQKLLVRDNLLNTLMDYFPDNIYFKDRESRFIAASRAMACRHGESDPAGMVDKTDFDYFSEEHARQALADEQHVITTGFPMVGTVEKETWPDGRVTWVSSTKLPLRDTAGRIIGTFGMSRDFTARKRNEEQLARLAEELRSRNHALEEDLAMARELQNALLPQQYPSFPHSARNGDGAALRFCHFFNPSTSISGDFFDVLDVGDTQAGIFVCDVMGHGVRAALVAAIIRTLVHDLKEYWERPGDFLTRLNLELRNSLRAMQSPIFASAFYGVVDITRGELSFANAGHPRPLLVHHVPDEREPHPLRGGKHGPVLGLLDHATYNTSRETLSAQDVVLLFTDGLFEVEGANGRLYDYDCLRESVSRRGDLPPATLCNEVISEIRQFSASKEFNDDVCLVAVELDHLV